MGSKLVKRGARAVARAFLAWVELPLLYRRERRERRVDEKGVSIIVQDTQYLPAEAVNLYDSLDAYDVNLRFFGICADRDFGFQHARSLARRAVAGVSHSATSVFLDDVSLLRKIRPHDGRVFVPVGLPVDDDVAGDIVADIVRRSGALPRNTPQHRLAERNPDGIDVSIIIPVHNGEATVRAAVESAIHQDYPRERVEIIVVDDGSTDATAAVLDSLEAEFGETVRSVRLDECSGTPARPRNVGLAQARGEYVFFLDADDWLGPEALRRMLAHALNWDSDLLLVRIVGEGGRVAPQSMFRVNQPDADIFRSKVMWSFGPYKLYRRSLVKGIRFPENCMPEDIGFVLRAYLAAKTVSVAADYDYYHLARIPEGDHSSETTWNDPAFNLPAYRDIVSLVLREVPAYLRDFTLTRRLFNRDFTNAFSALERRQQDDETRSLRRELVELTRPLYTDGALREMPEEGKCILERAYGGRPTSPIS